eukprot:6274773-Pyramimonas_sp.AAC.1
MAPRGQGARRPRRGAGRGTKLAPWRYSLKNGNGRGGGRGGRGEGKGGRGGRGGRGEGGG